MLRWWALFPHHANHSSREFLSKQKHHLGGLVKGWTSPSYLWKSWYHWGILQENARGSSLHLQRPELFNLFSFWKKICSKCYGTSSAFSTKVFGLLTHKPSVKLNFSSRRACKIPCLWCVLFVIIEFNLRCNIIISWGSLDSSFAKSHRPQQY